VKLYLKSPLQIIKGKLVYKVLIIEDKSIRTESYFLQTLTTPLKSAGSPEQEFP